MKLYIANQTCSQAVQIIANELGLTPELVHFDVFGRTTSSGEDFAAVNPLLYVPALLLDNTFNDILSETIVITSYLADQHPESGLIPARGTLERVKVDQLLTFVATEIAQKHIPLMRKLLTEDGTQWTRNKIVSAYAQLDARLADGRTWLTGDQFSVADAYVFATWWHERSGAQIEHLPHLMAWKNRIDARPSVHKALTEEAALYSKHMEQLKQLD
ncbi:MULTISPECIES: glutathione S-transferase family protein [Pseudomonas]|jgi:glutathione S-transferase|uniref:Glutathione S-transferase n=1 Tax=Pseudomonas fluorescens R124 TaxID=743713 RepID=A0A7U9GSS3_PSEFL|nr:MULTISPECIES: glutathione binding-like protein [Pseudomonas]EJZ58827.1 Glutathione S-transferase [Pseudomonas fluorescens R124]MCU1775037.1 glutathione binding-like protein [Pseudomonas sp. 13B_3.2_Bac1]RBC01450.1 glutathione S-transferase [Pseudomonas sp. MWU12-2115]RBL72777.1 glutathione S-transferase [Pseudomonas sp. MWU13-2625]